jgi:serine/threonine protein kinase
MKLSSDAKSEYNSGETKGGGGDYAEDVDVIRLKDLKILAKLGEGSSGCVHQALHRPTGRLFAVKEIALEVSAQMRKQIEIELKTLYCASCPQIIRFFGAFFYEGAFSIVTEFMDIGSLHDVISSHKATLSEGVVAGICAQILEGLRYLHKVQKV